MLSVNSSKRFIRCGYAKRSFSMVHTNAEHITGCCRWHDYVCPVKKPARNNPHTVMQYCGNRFTHFAVRRTRNLPNCSRSTRCMKQNNRQLFVMLPLSAYAFQSAYRSIIMIYVDITNQSFWEAFRGDDVFTTHCTANLSRVYATCKKSRIS